MGWAEMAPILAQFRAIYEAQNAIRGKIFAYLRGDDTRPWKTLSEEEKGPLRTEAAEIVPQAMADVTAWVMLTPERREVISEELHLEDMGAFRDLTWAEMAPILAKFRDLINA